MLILVPLLEVVFADRDKPSAAARRLTWLNLMETNGTDLSPLRELKSLQITQ